MTLSFVSLLQFGSSLSAALSCHRHRLALDLARAVRVDLELLDQSPQFGGRLDQLLRRLLRVVGAARRALRRLGYARDVLVISPLPFAASVTLRDISLVVAVCSSTAVAMVLEMSLIWLMTSPIVGDGVDRRLGVGLDGLDLAADVLGGLGGLLGQFLDFVGDDGEALAGLAGAGGFDGGVQGEQVGLLGDGSDDLDDLADLGAGVAELGDGGVGGLGDLDGRGGDLGGFGGVLGDFLDAGAHLFGAGGDGLQVLADLLGGVGDDVGLGGGFLGIGGDLLARAESSSLALATCIEVPAMD